MQQCPTWPRQAGLPCPQGLWLLPARCSILALRFSQGLDQGCRWPALASRARQCSVPRKRRQRSWRPRRHVAPSAFSFLEGADRSCDDGVCLHALGALYVTLRHRAGPASCRSGVAALGAGVALRFARLRAALVWPLDLILQGRTHIKSRSSISGQAWAAVGLWHRGVHRRFGDSAAGGGGGGGGLLMPCSAPWPPPPAYWPPVERDLPPRGANRARRAASRSTAAASAGSSSPGPPSTLSRALLAHWRPTHTHTASRCK